MATDRAGQVLGDRYRLLRLVGAGGMGEVYEAEHIYINKRVALKLLRPDLAEDREAVQRLQREAQATSAIGHENIVRIEDFGFTDDGVVFLAMEWLEGETLDVMIERGPIDLSEGLEIVYQVCRGLAAAHAAGVVHRDLKPPNIFVLRDEAGAPHVKLVDFGIAKLLFDDAGITQTGMIVGTPHYMSPEQGQGEEVDHRADVYAVGIILYEIVSGAVPFPSSEFFAVLHDHAITAPPRPSQVARGRGVTPVLEALILRCLEKEPKDRFQDMVELQRAIDSARGVTSERAERGPSAERPRTSPRETLSPETGQHSAVRPPPIVEEPADDSLEFPAARRGGRRLLGVVVAILVAGLAGVVTFALLDDDDAPVRDPQLAAADAAPPPPDAAPPALTVQDTIDGSGIEVRVSPDPVAANEPLRLDFAIVSPSEALGPAVASGRLTARVEYEYYRDHRTVAEAALAIGGDGAAVEPDRRRLPQAGKYHVDIAVRDGDAIVLRTRFDLCVGGGPCPGMPGN